MENVSIQEKLETFEVKDCPYRTQVLAGEVGPIFSIVIDQMMGHEQEVIDELEIDYIKDYVQEHSIYAGPSTILAQHAFSKLFDTIDSLPVFSGELETDSGSIRDYVSLPSYSDTLKGEVVDFQPSFTLDFALPGYLYAKSVGEKLPVINPDYLTGREIAHHLLEPGFGDGLIELSHTGVGFWTRSLHEGNGLIDSMALSPLFIGDKDIDWKALAEKYDLEILENGFVPISIDKWWIFNEDSNRFEIGPILIDAMEAYRRAINQYALEHPNFEGNREESEEYSFNIGTTIGCPVSVKGGLLSDIVTSIPETAEAITNIAEVKDNGRFTYRRQGNAILQLNEFIAKLFDKQLGKIKPIELAKS